MTTVTVLGHLDFHAAPELCLMTTAQLFLCFCGNLVTPVSIIVCHTLCPLLPPWMRQFFFSQWLQSDLPYLDDEQTKVLES